MNAIEIKGLTKHYKDFSLSDVSFSLPQGSILGLVGENGAGKSTTLNLIMNTISRDAGAVTVLGTDNRSKDFFRVKDDIGVVLDEAYYPEVLNARQIQKIMQHTYRNWDGACFQNYLKQFQLPDNKAVKGFSRGMRMKLAIAVALSHQAKLLLLDEATSGLDPMVRDEILDLFNDFTRDESHSVLLSSHITSDLEKICDYIAFIHRGRLLFCEEKDRLLEEYAIVKLTQETLAGIAPEAVRGKKTGKYDVEVLVRKSEIPKSIPVEHTTLEDIVLFLAKGDDAK